MRSSAVKGDRPPREAAGGSISLNHTQKAENLRRMAMVQAALSAINSSQGHVGVEAGLVARARRSGSGLGSKGTALKRKLAVEGVMFGGFLG